MSQHKETRIHIAWHKPNSSNQDENLDDWARENNIIEVDFIEPIYLELADDLDDENIVYYKYTPEWAITNEQDIHLLLTIEFDDENNSYDVSLDAFGKDTDMWPKQPHFGKEEASNFDVIKKVVDILFDRSWSDLEYYLGFDKENVWIK